jgi:hypothetical protein
MEPEENNVEWPLTAGQVTYISSIRDRRVLIADQQKGLAVGFPNFYHDSTVAFMPPAGNIISVLP